MTTDTVIDTPPARTTPADTASAARQVPTRRMSFEESLQDLPRHFAADGDLLLSHLAAALSSLFPDGEEFFVRSVRHYRNQIEDPVLRRQVAGFIGQEAMHGREHRALNERLAELGYPTRRYERFTARGLKFRERVAPAISNLASTAALEHFTATLAELLLTSEEAQGLFGDAAMRDLFVWHALEESEHKAVAFDVYRVVGGSERLRIITMKLTRVGLIGGLAVMVALSLLGDRATFRRGRLRSSFTRFRRSPLMQREVWRQLREYDRVGFHPDDRPTAQLIDTWREELFGENGSLNDKLIGAAPAASA